MRAELRRFAVLIERKLAERDAERGDSWRTAPPAWLYGRAIDEMREVVELLSNEHGERGPSWPSDVARECADAAGFLMFLAARVGGLPAQKEGRETFVDEDLRRYGRHTAECPRDPGHPAFSHPLIDGHPVPACACGFDKLMEET